jgi:hypothetical protein
MCAVGMPGQWKRGIAGKLVRDVPINAWFLTKHLNSMDGLMGRHCSAGFMG